MLLIILSWKQSSTEVYFFTQIHSSLVKTKLLLAEVHAVQKLPVPVFQKETGTYINIDRKSFGSLQTPYNICPVYPNVLIF